MKQNRPHSNIKHTTNEKKLPLPTSTSQLYDLRQYKTSLLSQIHCSDWDKSHRTVNPVSTPHSLLSNETNREKQNFKQMDMVKIKCKSRP